jgi:L-ascorbate metabolism protein UlaG (beta-lactamase superfamily)
VNETDNTGALAAPTVDDIGTHASAREGSVIFVGKTSVILRYGGFTILTDPNFLHQGEQVPHGHGLLSRRGTEPVFGIDDLPTIDFVVLSHLHEDHFDRTVAQRMDKAVPIVTTWQAEKKLRDMEFNQLQGLDHWQSVKFGKGDFKVTLTSLPGVHGRGPAAALIPKVMGTMLEFHASGKGPESAPLLRIYISGDTLVHEALHEIPRRYPDIDLGLLHLDNTHIAGVARTTDGELGVEALRIVRPRRAIPIHFNDTTAFQSPVTDSAHVASRAYLADRVHYLHRGETYTFEVPGERLGEG